MSTVSNMEEKMRQAVDSGLVPGLALLAKDRLGKLDYANCFGARSTGPQSAEEPFLLDTVMRLASASKLITSVACMQAVERGMLQLDDDVSKLVPELDSFDILTGFDAKGNPELRKRTKALTLRHLLSHSSGLCYDAMHPLLIKYRAWQGIQLQPGGDRIEDRFTYPLVYEPGDGWTYGPSLEWAGRLIERACGESLEDLMQRHICAPLNIPDMTFKLQARPDMIARRATLSERGEDAVIRPSNEAYWRQDPIDAMGGMGIFTTPQSYMKVLHSLLVDDGKLLRPETTKIMFQRQLDTKAETALMELFNIEEMNTKMGALLPIGVKKNHALGGLLLEEPLDGENWRSEGSMIWSGLPNVFWFIDRRAGICALYASQLTPPGDEPSCDLARLFERTMYKRLRAA